MWALAMRLIVRLFGLVNVAILARLLTKEDFGLVALLISSSAVLTSLLDIIVRVGLVRISDLRDEHYGAAFILRLLGGLLVAAVLVLSAAPIASFYEEPHLRAGLYVFAAIIALEGLASPWVMSFQRNLEFSKDFTYEVVVGLGRVAASIAFALWFRNFWGIIAGLAVASLLRVIFSYIMCWGGTLRWDRNAIVDFWHICKWASVESIAYFAEGRVDRLMIGKSGTTTQLGAFSVVLDLVTLPIGNLILPIGRAVLPGLHKMRLHAPKKVAAAYGTAVSSMVAVSLPVGLGMVIVADPMVRVLLGDNWAEVGPLVQLLAPYVIAESVMASFQQVMVVEGSLRAVTVLRWGRTLLYLPAVYFGFLWYGLSGAVIAKSVMAVISILPAYMVLHWGGRIKWGPDTWQIVRSGAASLLMLVPWFWWGPWLSAMLTTSLQQFLVTTVIGAVAFILSILLLWQVTGRPDGLETRLLAMVVARLQKKTS